MTDHKIKPEKITKPIQLLGAWLAGLLAIDSCFLIAAHQRPHGSWESTALTIAAIVNVPLFLIAVFLLQTKYRPELQEDLYYSTYINQKTNSKVTISREDATLVQVQQRLERIESAMAAAQTANQAPYQTKSLANVKFGINKHLNDKEAIAKRLAEAGVAGYTHFGAKTPPDKRVVAVSEYLPDDVARAVLDMAAELGFKHYNYFDNLMENTSEEVLFGAYGDAEFELAKPKA